MFKEEVLKKLGYTITDLQLKQFELYFDYLIAYNEKVNLTRITERNEVFIKHFFDSLTIIKSVDFNQINNLCDMGSGAGFPSLPLKILYPHLSITIIDSLKKRITFLESLIDKLDLKDVKLTHNRIEIFAKDNFNTYDMVTARALGSLSLILEMGIPMVKTGGLFVAYKGSTYLNEIEVSKKAFEVLSCEIVEQQLLELPDNLGFRANIIIKKNKHIKGYPRTFALMTNKPL